MLGRRSIMLTFDKKDNGVYTVHRNERWITYRRVWLEPSFEFLMTSKPIPLSQFSSKFRRTYLADLEAIADSFSRTHLKPVEMMSRRAIRFRNDRDLDRVAEFRDEFGIMQPVSKVDARDIDTISVDLLLSSIRVEVDDRRITIYPSIRVNRLSMWKSPTPDDRLTEQSRTALTRGTVFQRRFDRWLVSSVDINRQFGDLGVLPSKPVSAWDSGRRIDPPDEGTGSLGLVRVGDRWFVRDLYLGQPPKSSVKVTKKSEKVLVL